MAARGRCGHHDFASAFAPCGVLSILQLNVNLVAARILATYGFATFRNRAPHAAKLPQVHVRIDKLVESEAAVKMLQLVGID